MAKKGTVSFTGFKGEDEQIVLDIDDNIAYPSNYKNLPLVNNVTTMEIKKSAQFLDELKVIPLANWCRIPTFKQYLTRKNKIYITGRHDFQREVTESWLKKNGIWQEGDTIIFMNFSDYDSYVAQKVGMIYNIITTQNAEYKFVRIFEDSVSIVKGLALNFDIISKSQFACYLTKDGEMASILVFNHGCDGYGNK